MLTAVKGLCQEVLFLLIAMRIVWFMVPRPIKNVLRRITRSLYQVNKNYHSHANRHVRTYYKQREKAAVNEQPLSNNIITVKYPNGKIRKYYK